jgi:hypothetical protein
LQAARAGGKGIDRIILYIDDVDRCPPHMVVDILQAVHLLLAYDLFVVVVSVDPRWLLRSLEVQVSQLKPGGSTLTEGMEATPQDYLEKIFQIPFSVRPMGQQGFARLMRRLLPDSTDELSLSPELRELDSEPSPKAQLPALSEPVRNLSDERETTPQSATPSTLQYGPTLAEAPDLEDLVEVLRISAAETDFSQTLYMLLPTPRSAKRFANVYRLLKASLPRSAVQNFQGARSVPGDFQLPMLLLALLIGKPKLAARLFPLLLASARQGREDWWQAAWDAAKPNSEELYLRELLDPIVEAPYFPRSPQLVETWLPQVSRFSFTTAKLFLDPPLVLSTGGVPELQPRG